jgi:hypothetical protein
VEEAEGVGEPNSSVSVLEPSIVRVYPTSVEARTVVEETVECGAWDVVPIRTVSVEGPVMVEVNGLPPRETVCVEVTVL